MATHFPLDQASRPTSALADPARAIGGVWLDAIFFWGSPAIALATVYCWVGAAARMAGDQGDRVIALLIGAMAVITYAHLIAVVPRAYLNRAVFAANRGRLTVVPVVLIAALLLSPPLLVCAAVVAIFWDVHHSAMQTFGLARIYDMKAGNDSRGLRRVDLALSWALYVGPLAAGAALAVHMAHFQDFGALGWSTLATLPREVAGWTGTIRLIAIGSWGVTLLYAGLRYRQAMRGGYRMPAQKAALLVMTGGVSIAAWLLMPPFAALACVNLFHAMQYFAIVWLKEGNHIRALAPLRHLKSRSVILLFGLACAAFGGLYSWAAASHVLLAPFVACSLLHFWYDGFIWSVRKNQV